MIIPKITSTFMVSKSFNKLLPQGDLSMPKVQPRTYIHYRPQRIVLQGSAALDSHVSGPFDFLQKPTIIDIHTDTPISVSFSLIFIS